MFDFLRLFFPPRCIFCSTLLEFDKNIEICDSCYEEIPFSEPGYLPSSKEDKISCNGIICACSYKGIVKEALKRYKFKGKASYCRAFAKLLTDKVKTETGNKKFDIIVSVPLHRKRERLRGYNQSELISRLLSRQTGIKNYPNILSRVRDTSGQSLITSKKDRYENIKNAFSVTDPKIVEGKSVILVDDIVTTGFTISECARVLMEAGASEVIAAVIASGRSF